MENTALQVVLERLAEADILLVQGIPPDSEYRFKHALTQDAAYENLLTSRRQALHHRVAEGAAKFFGARDALEAGQNFFGSRLGNDQARLALAKMSPMERQLFQDGYVDKMMRFIHESGDRRRNIAAQLANSDAARERMSMVLGPQRAKELEAMIHTENVMDAARYAVQGNSTTARQLTELGLATGVYGLEGYHRGDPFDPQAAAYAALTYGAMRGRNVINERVARQVAHLLVSQDPQKVNSAMKLIAASPQMMGALRLTSSNLASLGARATAPVVSRRPVLNVPPSPTWRGQAPINPVAAAGQPAAMPKGPIFSTAPQ